MFNGIKLCQKHADELALRWGGRDKIIESYGSLVIADASQCENLECVQARMATTQTISCPVCGRPLKIIKAE